MGLLDNLLGGQNNKGGVSPLALGLLALLAYKTSKGQGPLAGMFGGQQPQQGDPGQARASTEGGGLGGMLGSLFGGRSQQGGATGGGDLLGGLGGLLGSGAGGSILGAGLNDLLSRFQDTGAAGKAQTWVSTGANEAISPDELEQAVGQDNLQALADKSGRPYGDVLQELSHELPKTVDRLTPEGRVPSPEELRQA